MPTHLKPPMLTIQDVADETRVDPRTIWLEIHRGNLRASRVGKSWRISRENLDAYLKQRQSA
jgi:excisionase family DNA binding protein